jgi:thiosulfate/3-mercaptopyruvate sulfurtransferase
MRFTSVWSLFSLIGAMALLCAFVAGAGTPSSEEISPGAPASGESPAAGPFGETSPALIQPADLASILNSPKDPKPLLIQVGFRVLYVQAHIPGSEFIGPAYTPDAVRRLHKRAEPLPRTQFIVLYCGCCPWSECPNVRPAYKELDAMGFKNVKLLYVAHNFGEDWVRNNYPVAKGE